MAKKFVPQPTYEPARLVEGSDRWYIVWYCLNDKTDKYERYRFTFRLNRITNLKKRRHRANEIIEKLNWWMAEGQPISRFREDRVAVAMASPKRTELEQTKVIKALEVVRDLKMKNEREDSVKTYKSHAKLLIDFIEQKGWGKLAVADWKKPHVVTYMDHCTLVRKISPASYNNTLTFMRIFWGDLILRGYVKENPWKEIAMQPKRKIKKRRRNFTAEEARIVINRIRAEDQMLFLGLLLEYSCFIRPKELRLLRIGDFDFVEGIIKVEGRIAKDWEDRFVTIPDSFVSHIPMEIFSQYPQSFYLFGTHIKPNTKPCGHGSMYRKHQRILKALHQEGKLQDITGLTWYSWKDTGITDALDELLLIGVQEQAGHSKPEMTMKYRHARKVNQHMKKFRNKLL